MTDDASDADDGAGPTEIVLTLKDALGDTSNADFVAFQDGDGAWVSLTGSDGVYRAMVTGERYGLVIVCASSMPTGYRSAYFATVDDPTAIERPACNAPAATRVLTGTVTGASNVVSVTVDTTNGGWTSNQLGNYSLTTKSGELDVLVSAQRGDGTTVMARKQTTANVLDFDLAGAPVASPRTLDVAGQVAGESLRASSWVATPGGLLRLGSGTQLRALTLPAALARPGDKTVFSVGSSRTLGALSVTPSIEDVVPTLTLPEARSFTAPNANLEVGIPAVGDGDGISISIRDAGYFSLQYATRAWLGDASTFKLVDPTEAPGWQADWNQPTAWTNWSGIWLRRNGDTYASSTTFGPR